MSLVTKIYGAITARLTDSDDLGALQYTLSMTTLFKSMSSGTGDNQSDIIFTDQRTLASEATEDLDLAGGTESPFGVPLTFAAVKAIIVKAAADNVNDVVIGGQDTNGFQGPLGDPEHTIAVSPGGIALLAAPKDGWVVTGGYGDLLTITNGGSGSDVIYDIVIIGVSE